MINIDPINGIMLSFKPYNKESTFKAYIQKWNLDLKTRIIHYGHALIQNSRHCYLEASISFSTDVPIVGYPPLKIIGCLPLVSKVFSANGIWELNCEIAESVKTERKTMYYVDPSLKTSVDWPPKELPDIDDCIKINTKEIWESNCVLYLEQKDTMDYNASTVNIFRWISMFGTIPREAFNH